MHRSLVYTFCLSYTLFDLFCTIPNSELGYCVFILRHVLVYPERGIGGIGMGISSLEMGSAARGGLSG